MYTFEYKTKQSKKAIIQNLAVQRSLDDGIMI